MTRPGLQGEKEPEIVEEELTQYMYRAGFGEDEKNWPAQNPLVKAVRALRDSIALLHTLEAYFDKLCDELHSIRNYNPDKDKGPLDQKEIN